MRARPVLAGPVEATATGNLLVQAIASGALANARPGGSAPRRGAPRRCAGSNPRDATLWRRARGRYRDLSGRR